jgi:hypothetical protein
MDRTLGRHERLIVATIIRQADRVTLERVWSAHPQPIRS